MAEFFTSKDPMLERFSDAIKERHRLTLQKEAEFTGCGARSLRECCNSHLYYGLHRTEEGTVIREWAPSAEAVYLLGEFNDWRKHPEYAFTRKDSGNWEITVPDSTMPHGTLYRLLVEWKGGSGERIPSHATRTVQDEYTKRFSAQVWTPERPYRFRYPVPPRPVHPMIYEAHAGMSTELRKVSSFREFTTFILPRIKEAGYNTVQLMAIQEHPYYGSFGYQVSSFFAPSSRFGTPEDLKELVDEAHGMGLRVIMDLVHSHAVKNEEEGLGRFDGTSALYFYPGEKGYHRLWDSRCFDYGKGEVLNFLLSNCKYWLEEFRFDGFRFDGVTSMMYLDHGLGRDFTDYSMYFDGNQDINAIIYLGLANRIIHQIRPDAVTVAEEMSGMPGLAAPLEEGGMGFDYRMSMGIPDYWIKLIKERKDEFWHVGDIFHELTSKRAEEHTVSYAESHDQALVGDKTIFFRLADKEIYSSMGIFSQSGIIDRAMSLHKIIRLLTIGTAPDGYLNFMGNEWGHPEWIDFPREGNGWSYDHARRQWSLLDDPGLRFRFLGKFDRDMISLFTGSGIMDKPAHAVVQDIERQVLVFSRGDYLLAFNLSPERSYSDYRFRAEPGKYCLVLDTDSRDYDGHGRNDPSAEHFTVPDADGSGILGLYLPARTGMVLRRS